jgi:hypothetical protein
MKMAAINTKTENNTLTITTDVGVITVHVNKLHQDIINAAVLHGLKQKIVDAAAISRNPDTGRSATIQDKFDAMNEVFLRITDPLEPSWNKIDRDTGSGAQGGLLIRALVRLYPTKTREDLDAYVSKLDAKQQAAVRATARVAAVIETIKAEDAAKRSRGGVGNAGEDLLAGLEDGPF